MSFLKDIALIIVRRKLDILNQSTEEPWESSLKDEYDGGDTMLKRLHDVCSNPATSNSEYVD